MRCIGSMLCDSCGRPKVRSIREADARDEAKFGGFLHVKRVWIKPRHRPSDGTHVVALAVRAALTVPELAGTFTLVTAVTDPNVYMKAEEVERRKEIRSSAWRRARGIQDDADADDGTAATRAQEKRRLDARWRECVMLDARTYIRSGCRQIPEVVEIDMNQLLYETPWFFALPGFLNGLIMSHEEAMAVKIKEPPDLPPAPSEVDAELLAVVESACRKHNEAMVVVRQLEYILIHIEQRVKEEDESEILMQVMEYQTEQASTELDREKLVEVRAGIYEKAQAELKRKHDITTFKERCTKKRKEIKGEKDFVLGKVRTDLHNLKAKVTALGNEKGSSIRKSFALHCSARYFFVELVDLLLGFVPNNELKAAINDIDSDGIAPLHSALMGTHERGNPEKCYRTMAHLLALGASKSNVDAYGRTPLGQFRMIELMEILGETEEAQNARNRRFEELLMPIGGETDADRDMYMDTREYHSSSEESSEWETDLDDESDDEVDDEEDLNMMHNE